MESRDFEGALHQKARRSLSTVPLMILFTLGAATHTHTLIFAVDLAASGKACVSNDVRCTMCRWKAEWITQHVGRARHYPHLHARDPCHRSRSIRQAKSWIRNPATSTAAQQINASRRLVGGGGQSIQKVEMLT